MTDVDMNAAWDEMVARWGNAILPFLHNMASHFHDGVIVDPELPGFNGASLFLYVWSRVKVLDAYDMFYETALAIGTTCIQGISHRLIGDWVAIQK